MTNEETIINPTCGRINCLNDKDKDEKQIPKKPNKVHIYYYYEEGNCPSCGVIVDSKSNYCAKCGQKLDWED